MDFLINLLITLGGNLVVGIASDAVDHDSRPQPAPTHQEQPATPPQHSGNHKD